MKFPKNELFQIIKYSKREAWFGSNFYIKHPILAFKSINLRISIYVIMHAKELFNHFLYVRADFQDMKLHFFSKTFKKNSVRTFRKGVKRPQLKKRCAFFFSVTLHFTLNMNRRRWKRSVMLFKLACIFTSDVFITLWASFHG